MNAAVSEHKKTLKIRPSGKYLDLYKVLLKNFKEARLIFALISTGFGPRLAIYIVKRQMTQML